MVVINFRRLNSALWLTIVLVISTISLPLTAAVLPSDRSDALYHYYDGGGIDVQGPSILVRKSIKDKVSVSANYYVDNISSASIDVVTTASAYTERRVETSVGIDYLHDKTIMSFNYTQSDENDFSARSAHFNVAQDFFGDLTTLNVGYSQGWDTVGKRGDDEFSEDVIRRQLRLGVSQVITKNSILNLAFETITDEGYLNNPYRQVRYLDAGESRGYGFRTEVYPSTRTSDAFAIRAMYYLPYRAAAKLEYKIFSDTWGIEATTTELAYTHPIGDDWILDASLRHYDQGQANFYSDLFSSFDAQNFLARDKEMSAFSSASIGLGVSYLKELPDWQYIDKYSISFKLNHFQFDYANFKDLTFTDLEAGSEPLYSFNSNVIRFFVSFYY